MLQMPENKNLDAVAFLLGNGVAGKDDKSKK